MIPTTGAVSLVAAGRYAIYHLGAEAGEERWSVEPAADGGVVARGVQVLDATQQLQCELEWRALL